VQSSLIHQGNAKKALTIDIIFDIFLLMVREDTKDFILRLPVELFRQLEREVRLQKSNRTKVVRKALSEYLIGQQLARDLELDFKSERAKEMAPKAKAATQR
jgi:hypothetical protein